MKAQCEDMRRAQSGTGCTKDVEEASAVFDSFFSPQPPSVVEAG